MGAPVLQKIWTISANNRLTPTSLNNAMGQWLKKIADVLLANGYTCKGSSNGAAAAMDGVNRWAAVADASTRAANTTTAVSWMVLTDGNGCDILMSYVGASDGIARLSFSPSGAYVAAGTPTFTPTAADELVLFTAVNLITTDTTTDRVLHIWIDSEAKMFRVATHVNQVLTDGTWGVELVNANRVSIAFSPAVWGFSIVNANTSLATSTFFAAGAASSRGGQARINGTNVVVGCGAEAYNAGSYVVFANGGATGKPELQKSVGLAMFPILIGSTTATRQGTIGSLFDWWTGKGSNPQPGDVVFPGGEWIQISNQGSGPVWPWDGVTQPQVS